MYTVTEEQIMVLCVNYKIPCRRFVRRSCRNEIALFRLIASAFGRKEHLVDANSSHAHDDTESGH